MYKKILVPLDGSELAECSLNHVKNLFQTGKVGKVVLLNVVVVDIPWRTLNVGEEGHSITFDINSYIKPFIEKARKSACDEKGRLWMADCIPANGELNNAGALRISEFDVSMHHRRSEMPEGTVSSASSGSVP